MVLLVNLVLFKVSRTCACFSHLIHNQHLKTHFHQQSELHGKALLGRKKDKIVFTTSKYNSYSLNHISFRIIFVKYELHKRAHTFLHIAYTSLILLLLAHAKKLKIFISSCQDDKPSVCLLTHS